MCHFSGTKSRIVMNYRASGGLGPFSASLFTKLHGGGNPYGRY